VVRANLDQLWLGCCPNTTGQLSRRPNQSTSIYVFSTSSLRLLYVFSTSSLRLPSMDFARSPRASASFLAPQALYLPYLYSHLLISHISHIPYRPPDPRDQYCSPTSHNNPRALRQAIRGRLTIPTITRHPTHESPPRAPRACRTNSRPASRLRLCRPARCPLPHLSDNR